MLELHGGSPALPGFQRRMLLPEQGSPSLPRAGFTQVRAVTQHSPAVLVQQGMLLETWDSLACPLLLPLVTETLPNPGNWTGGNSLVCSQLLPRATTPRELEMQELYNILEMQEHPSKANTCVTFRVLCRKCGEQSSPQHSGGHTGGWHSLSWCSSIPSKNQGNFIPPAAAPEAPEELFGSSGLKLLHYKNSQVKWNNKRVWVTKGSRLNERLNFSEL